MFPNIIDDHDHDEDVAVAEDDHDDHDDKDVSETEGGLTPILVHRFQQSA